MRSKRSSPKHTPLLHLSSNWFDWSPYAVLTLRSCVNKARWPGCVCFPEQGMAANRALSLELVVLWIEYWDSFDKMMVELK